MKDGQPTQWSHMLGVRPEARGSRAGPSAEARAARAALPPWARSDRVDLDPLQALNAHLNFTKLGVVVEEYEENIYGESSSPLHRGTPTDRFVARMAAERAARGAANLRGRDRLLMRDSRRRDGAAGESVDGARAMARARRQPTWLDGPALVEIPDGFTDMLRHGRRSRARLAPARARDLSDTYFARGYRAVDFF